MIRSYRDRKAARIHDGFQDKRLGVLSNKARRKIDQVNKAAVLGDLAKPPGNRLELLQGRCRGQYSIRINERWRICFRWDDATGDAFDVEVVDYHDESRGRHS